MHRALAITTILSLLPFAARAEDAARPGDPEPASVDAGRDVFRDPDVVVIGRPPEAPEVTVFEDSAIQTEWITEQQIQNLPASDVAGVVQFLAGIRTTQRIQGEGAAVSIEGMPAEYTDVLVDGQRFSGEIGGAGDLSDIPLLNVERIEVLRGVQGARFGTDAAGGVINVITKNAPPAGYRVEGRGEGGTDDMALGGAAVGGRVGRLGLSLTGFYDQIDGFDPPDDPDVVLASAGGSDSRNRQHFLYGKWDAPFGENVSLRGNGLWRVENDDYVFDDGGSEHANHTDTNWRANTGLDWQLREGTNLSSDLTYYAVDTKSQVGRNFDLFENEVSSDLYADHELQIGSVHNVLRGGFDLDWQRLDLNEGKPTIDTDAEELGNRNLDEDLADPSIYVQTESELREWLTLVLGVRGQFHTDFDPKALPQVAVLVKPLDTLKLRASWGQSYRTPSLRDLYQPPTVQLNGAYLLAGNEDVKPEKSMSVRAGFEWVPSGWMSLAVTGFYNDIDDHIRSEFDHDVVLGRHTILVYPEDLTPPEVSICEAQRMFFPDPADWTPECAAYFAGEPISREVIDKAPLFVKKNLDSVQTYGAETQLRARWGSNLELFVDYTFLKTHVVDSNVDADELPNEPEHAVSLRTVMISPWYDTQLTSAFQWRGPVIPEGSGTGLLTFADASHRTDPSYALDFRIAQPLDDFAFFDGLRLHLDALNVTDERREDSYAIRGRSFVAGISGRFGSAR